jgi:hypothetical protein
MTNEQFLKVNDLARQLAQEIFTLSGGSEGKALAILDKVSLMLLAQVRAAFEIPKAN